MAMPGASTGRETNTPSFRAWQEAADHVQEAADHVERLGLRRDETSSDVADIFLKLKQSTVLDQEHKYKQKQKARLAALSFAFLQTSYEASQVCGSVFLSVLGAQDDSVKTLEALRGLQLPPLDKAHRFQRNLQRVKNFVFKLVPHDGHVFHKHLQQIESLFELVRRQDTFPDSLRKNLDKVAKKCKEGEVKDEKNALRKKKRVKVRMPAHKIKVKFQDKFFHGRGISDCTEKKEPLWDRCFKIGLLKKRQKLLDTLTREYVALEAQLQIVKSECYGLHKHMQSNISLVTRSLDSRHDVVFVQEFTDQLTRNQIHFKDKLSGTKVQVLLCFKLINCARCLVWTKLKSVLGSPKGF